MFVIWAVCAKMRLIKVTLPLVTFYSIYFKISEVSIKDQISAAIYSVKLSVIL